MGGIPWTGGREGAGRGDSPKMWKDPMQSGVAGVAGARSTARVVSYMPEFGLRTVTLRCSDSQPSRAQRRCRTGWRPRPTRCGCVEKPIAAFQRWVRQIERALNPRLRESISGSPRSADSVTRPRSGTRLRPPLDVSGLQVAVDRSLLLGRSAPHAAFIPVHPPYVESVDHSGR